MNFKGGMDGFQIVSNFQDLNQLIAVSNLPQIHLTESIVPLLSWLQPDLRRKLNHPGRSGFSTG